MAFDPQQVALSHHNLANHLRGAAGDIGQIWAHFLAAAVVTYQMGGDISSYVQLGARPRTTFAEIASIVSEVDGVHLADLVDRLPKRAPDGQAALDEILKLVG
ncbi:MAG TPA: hypothetical protein VFX16_11290 [Pseudonocardiaceae bacterium]|nr:hypothetical protein [Pseudonocardiaceae bacterium]